MSTARPYRPVAELPTPPALAYGEVKLRFLLAVAARPVHKLVPYYSFRIVDLSDTDVGHINLRIGECDHVMRYAGHIGYSVTEGFRGHGYAEQACRALGPFARSVAADLVLTCDPENAASRRTIEKLGATYIDEVVVPPDDPQYTGGARRKLRFRWTP